MDPGRMFVGELGLERSKAMETLWSTLWVLIGAAVGWMLVLVGIQIGRRTAYQRWDWTPEKEEKFQELVKRHIEAHVKLEKKE